MEDDMRELKILLAGLLILGTSAGCGFRERRWGWCAVGGGLVGAAVGAGTAGGLVNAYEKGRTRAVRDYLVREGIDPSRITTRGYGKSRPVASNDTAEGRAQNRRAEVVAD